MYRVEYLVRLELAIDRDLCMSGVCQGGCVAKLRDCSCVITCHQQGGLL